MKKIEQFYLDGLYKGLSVINLVINKVFKPATSNSIVLYFLILYVCFKHFKKLMN